jgi:uncharacterized protein
VLLQSVHTFALSLAVPVAIAATGCGNGSPARPDAFDTTFDRNALLANLASNVLLPIQADVDAKAALLPAAIATYCDALDAGSAGTTLDTARTAWGAAVDAWERADTVRVGPADMDNGALRDRIYAWPSLAPCDIDRDVLTHWNTPGSYDLSTKLGRQRSLTTIEFLLYPPSNDHNCAVEPSGWTALQPDLPRARCRLAHTLAVDVAAAASELHTAWRADGGDYVGQLARAGTADSSLPSAHEAVNLVSNSFFYIDRVVKDMKLGEAAGIVMGNACGTINEPCIREVELRYADRATFAIRVNLATLRDAVTGMTATSQGPGFDDFLDAIGHPELAASMTSDLDTALAKATALPDSFLAALSTSYSSVVDTHTAIKQFTNDLKSQFLTVLALDIPDDVASDND